MCSLEERVRRHVVIALAYLSSPLDHQIVFIHNQLFLCTLISIFIMIYCVLLHLGKIFYAHKDRLHPSKAFRTMFEGKYWVSMN